MVALKHEDIMSLTRQADAIRNVSIISQKGNGRSRLLDSLLARGGIILADPQTPSPSFSNHRECDLDRNRVTINPVSFPLYYPWPRHHEMTDNAFLINVVEPPSPLHPFSELTATLRITDGALVIVDCIDGLSSLTESMLRQTLLERVKPLLLVNKLDRAIFQEVPMTPEDLYQSFSWIMETTNNVISIYQDTGAAMGNLLLHPANGTVAFVSGLQGWGFTLQQFANRYAKKFGVEKDKLLNKLWGDHFFDPTTKKWTTQNKDANGKSLERGFNQFVLDPIFKIFDAVAKSTTEPLLVQSILQKLDIKLTPYESGYQGRPLLKLILRNFLPLAESVLEMVVVHLPSPPIAQKYRLSTLYEGPMNDESATAMQSCDPSGSLVVYISKLTPANLPKGRFYAIGRIFSGTLKPGMQVRIQGPNYIPGKKDDLFLKNITSSVFLMGRYVEAMNECPAGNIVGIAGIDQFLLKNGTLMSAETAHNIKTTKFSTAPVVYIAVEPERPADLPKLLEGLKRLCQLDPCVESRIEKSGECFIAGAGEEHLEFCSRTLREEYPSIQLKISEPTVSYRETVKAESPITAVTKSANRHNTLYLRAMPLGEELITAIERKKIGVQDDRKVRAEKLTEEYEWDLVEARKIWCFGPDLTGPNVLVDCTKGVQYLNEIKDSCVAGFQWATKEGVCAEERMRGVRLNILDVTLLSDAIHRGGGQVIPTARRAVYAACLLAEPSLQEPIYFTEIQCPESSLDAVQRCLDQRRGQVFAVEPRQGTPMLTIKAYLPVAESFGFSSMLRLHTDDKAFLHSAFDHWEQMSGSPLEKGSKLEGLVIQIRMRKGLEPQIPSLQKCYDKL